jgi:transposase
MRLTKAARTSTSPKFRDRCRAILLSEDRKTPGQIAPFLKVHRITVQRWIKDYLRFGFQGLIPGKSPGRPPSVDSEGEIVLQKALAKNPRDMGYLFTRWTTHLLAEHLYRTTHARVSDDAVGRSLHRMRYRYKRPKLSLRHKQKRQEVRRARRERDAALKKSPVTPTDTSSCLKTNANSILIPA